MICSKCGKECYAVAETDGKAVSNCCMVEIKGEKGDQFTNHKHNIDYSKDQWQGNWHGGQHTSESVTGYPLSVKTLRDEIAIAAMQGMLSNPAFEEISKDFSGEDAIKYLTTVSWGIANSMIAERNK